MKILQVKNPIEEMQVRTHCPICGMSKSAWKENEGHGFWSGVEIYCCRGCVEGTGCTCDAVDHAPMRGKT